MVLQATRTSAPPRSWPRSIGAVFAGLLLIFILSTATDAVLHALDIYPPFGEPIYDTGPLLLALVYRGLYSVMGCYLAARLAPRAPMHHALALGGVGVVLGTVGAIVMWEMSAGWYPIALVLIAIPCGWLGGVLHLRKVSG